ncbi:MAG: TonB family protein [Methylocystis sp.]
MLSKNSFASVLMIFTMLALPAMAQNIAPSGANPPAQSSPQNGAPPSPASKAKIDAPMQPPSNITPAPQSTLSESKFLSALYAEIARRTPQDNALGEGEVTTSFHINANGRVDKVTIEKSTSPLFSEAVKKILASVEAPPPPGGSMDIGQTFKFHQSAPE